QALPLLRSSGHVSKSSLLCSGVSREECSCREEIRWELSDIVLHALERRIEIICHLAMKRTPGQFGFGFFQACNSGDGNAIPGNEDILTALGALHQSRETRLRLVHVNGSRHNVSLAN